MSKLFSMLELPILVLAGVVGQKVAAKLWTAVVGSDPPDTAQREVRIAALLSAAVIEGTLYKLTRMSVDRALRVALSGSGDDWVGQTGDGE